MRRPEPLETRRLIVNADDFGLSAGVNRGIIESHEHGIVTSASLMVRWPAAPAAAQYARGKTDFSIGLHLDLAEWTCCAGAWHRVYEVVPIDDAIMVQAEIVRQIAAFTELMGRGPTHLDSHQHVHRREPVRGLMAEAARHLGIPLRDHCPEIVYSGTFYGQAANGAAYPEGIHVEALIAIVHDLTPGVTELGCHPGYANDLDSMYAVERAQEVRALCDPRVRETLALERIVLVPFTASAP